MENPGDEIKCYDCGYDFTGKYNNPSHNLIIKHMDKTLSGKSDTGQIFCSVNFTPAYYHVNKLHILKKKHVFNGIVMISSPLEEKRGEERLTIFSASLSLTLLSKLL